MAIAPLPPRASYLEALTAEIRILIRAVVGDSEKDISQLKVVWCENQQVVILSYPHVVAVLAKAAPDGENELLERIGKLQLIRDALIRMTKPATGLSIAYTSLVTGNEGNRNSDSTYDLAQQAFGGLGRAAVTHRWSIRFLSILAVLLAFFASWEATKASLGKSLLQVLEPLRAQQSVIAGDKFKLELSVDKSLRDSRSASTTTLLPICDRYLMANPIAVSTAESVSPIRLYETAEIRELCGRDEILKQNFELIHQGLQEYLVDWPDMVGIGTGLRNTPHPVSGEDVEFRVAPVVQVITSYILPFMFGVIGSLLYVIHQHYMNVSTNTLIPRDQSLVFLRFILGIVVAACLSLLITASAGPGAPIQPSSSGSTAPGSLVGSLTLSASLITFLAGFGAEAVFTLLQNLVQRVFATPK